MKTLHRIGLKNVFRYRVGFIRNGVQHLLPWKNNLILDSGLDKIAGVAYANCFAFCLFGDQVSPTPVARNSGSVTFNTSTLACSASGAFFQSSDVGRLIKFDDGPGQEFYITGFTDSTHVALSGTASPAVVGQTATVWYVNQTSLESFYSATNTYRTGAGDCGTSFSGDTRTMKRTFTGSAVSGSPVTLTEIGFSNSGTNSAIFDRDIIVGGIGLIVGDIPLAIAELIQTFAPTTPAASPNNATGYNNAGTVQFCQMTNAISFVGTNGASADTNTNLEPATTAGTGIQASIGSWTFPAFNSNQTPNTLLGPSSEATAGYTPGSFFRDKSLHFDITSGVGTLTGFQMLIPGNVIGWGHLLTTPFAKSGSQTLDYTVRYSWQRFLQN